MTTYFRMNFIKTWLWKWKDDFDHVMHKIYNQA